MLSCLLLLLSSLSLCHYFTILCIFVIAYQIVWICVVSTFLKFKSWPSHYPARLLWGGRKILYDFFDQVALRLWGLFSVNFCKGPPSPPPAGGGIRDSQLLLWPVFYLRQTCMIYVVNWNIVCLYLGNPTKKRPPFQQKSESRRQERERKRETVLLLLLLLLILQLLLE